MFDRSTVKNLSSAVEVVPWSANNSSTIAIEYNNINDNNSDDDNNNSSRTEYKVSGDRYEYQFVEPKLKWGVLLEEERESKGSGSEGLERVLLAGLEAAEVMFDKLDKNGDDKIDLKEVEGSSTKEVKSSTVRQIRRSFKVLDADHDGSIQRSEWMEAYKRCYYSNQG